jgi:hypothetical protein
MLPALLTSDSIKALRIMQNTAKIGTPIHLRTG